MSKKNRIKPSLATTTLIPISRVDLFQKQARTGLTDARIAQHRWDYFVAHHKDFTDHLFIQSQLREELEDGASRAILFSAITVEAMINEVISRIGDELAVDMLDRKSPKDKWYFAPPRAFPGIEPFKREQGLLSKIAKLSQRRDRLAHPRPVKMLLTSDNKVQYQNLDDQLTLKQAEESFETMQEAAYLWFSWVVNLDLKMAKKVYNLDVDFQDLEGQLAKLKATAGVPLQ